MTDSHIFLAFQPINEKYMFNRHIQYLMNYSNVNSTIGPPLWQAEADRELTVSALPATGVGQLTLAN